MKTLMSSSQFRFVHRFSAGLGEAAESLAQAVRVGYPEIDIRIVTLTLDPIPEGFRRTGLLLFVRLDDQIVDLTVYEGRVSLHRPVTEKADEGLVCYLLQCPADLSFVSDTFDHAILLSQGTVELARRLPGFRPDVIHTHDWHAGLVGAYRDKWSVQDPSLGWMAVVHSVHNMMGPAFQGSFPNVHRCATRAGLSHLVRPCVTRSVEHYGNFNCTKTALAFSEVRNTVSVTYARELFLTVFADGLEDVIRELGIYGIPDGINLFEWDPGDDDKLVDIRYDANSSPEAIAVAKRACRRILREWTAPDGTHPFTELSNTSFLATQVSRIDFQKTAVLTAAIDRLADIPGMQLLILGSPHPGDVYGQEQARTLARKATDSNGRILMYSGYDLALSHVIFAAAQLFLVASTHEPFGLTAPISQRYGALPAVRETGGLDSIVDETAGAGANGFSFRESTDDHTIVDVPAAANLFVSTVERAVQLSRTDRERWFELVHNAMTRDSGWDAPASQYVRLYHEALRRRTEAVRIAG